MKNGKSLLSSSRGSQVKLPALPRGASVAKPPDFARRATSRSPLAILPRASTRGILAKASEKCWTQNRCQAQGRT